MVDGVTKGPACGRPRLNVAVATNAAYLPWCAVALVSCLESTPECDADVYLVHDADVTAGELSRLHEMVRSLGGGFFPLPLDPRRLGSLPSGVRAHGGAISCARFLLPETLPDVNRLLYLDADTLTVSSVKELWDTPLQDAALAAVPNVVDPAIVGRLRTMGFPAEMTYFNSGVLLMDLDALRMANAGQRVLDVIRTCGEALHWVDQDALNLALGREVQAIHPRWNAQNAFWFWREQAERCLGAPAVAAAIADPAVVHFEGHWLAKPWHYLCRHPFTATWRAALSRTPWADQPLLDRTAATRLIRPLPAPLRMRAYGRLIAWRRHHGRWPPRQA